MNNKCCTPANTNTELIPLSSPSKYQLETTKSKNKCNECGEKFNGKTAIVRLEKHIIKFHSDKLTQKYPCGKCSQEFPFQSYLERHLQLSNCKKAVEPEVKTKSSKNIVTFHYAPG